MSDLGVYDAIRDSRTARQQKRADERTRLESHPDYKEYCYWVRRWRESIADSMEHMGTIRQKQYDKVEENLYNKTQEMKREMLK